MAITGHRTLKQAMHYTKRVAKKRLALEAIAKLENAGRVANPGTPGVQKAG